MSDGELGHLRGSGEKTELQQKKALCIYALQPGRLHSISKFLANGPGYIVGHLRLSRSRFVPTVPDVSVVFSRNPWL